MALSFALSFPKGYFRTGWGLPKEGSALGYPRVGLRKELRVEVEGPEEFLWSLGTAAVTSAALAQPPSRPRRVPGGPVAGDWERSPAGPRAGPAREGEALAAVARPLGLRPPRRPSWASALALSSQSPVQLRGALGRGALGECGPSRRSPVCTALLEAGEGSWGHVSGRVYTEEEGNRPVDLSSRNRSFGSETCKQGWLWGITQTIASHWTSLWGDGSF